MSNTIQAILFWFKYALLLPTIVLQGKRLKQNSVRLPEADGARHYHFSEHGIELKHIGESTVAGVGVEHMKQGLTMQTVSALQNIPDIYPSNIDIYGVNGIALKPLLLQSHNWLNTKSTSSPCYIVTLGVNDTTGLTSIFDWSEGLMELIQRVRGQAKNAKIIFTHVPDMKRFPALPWPLNQFLGDRSALLDKALRRICETNECHYVEADIKIEEAYMAEDGYHPNAKGYERWGKKIADVICEAYQ
ncbi:SGNH/GDSL hydrolase family protein [Bermanella marisrubri]|uniref:SGNH hydrolase-type esterase domain-containing protein n=1 Tax=Bermanella marisrubri TaxID=207949 RepID=Q1MYG7_9GAMM|nr:SGNH/GDSL hydrolase family protein [Bermanella marisrubri]EAT10978.1 hypothetical protein RED65_02113 [Oceanobacter sp. RED65] [Bermanella marisrubri]QIZ83776.1 SGNH/GDSL hydrolase family protein [Bermanella marisrubri]